ncbi:AraC family transcriptional regulator [Brevibacillus massiliensis]|uniref:AraC family transcriptional regulator n=1 Tax=Brevibacillus massiliensis TaxID=1118054 RepID=UPI0002D43664|nr:AraC family transcriptional regulator [Brevibacillus massiliensis]
MSYSEFILPETGLLIYESKHQNGGLVAKHHHKIYQILYAIDGVGTITLDQKAHHFGQNQISFIVPYTNHAIESHTKLTVLVLSFREESLTSIINPDFFHLLKKESFVLGLNPVVASEIKLHLKKMLFEQRNQDRISTYAILVSLMNVLILLERSRTTVSYTDANTLRAERMRSYLETHYFSDITTKDLAALFEISVRYVNDIFKERFNTTPMQYLNNVRIDRAKDLLVETDKDIATICFEVGFENISTFYRSFKNVMGISPNKFREMHALS